MFLRDLNQIFIERDISEASYKHLKRYDFFVTSLRRLKYISKKMYFLWHLYNVSKTSQKRCLLYDIFKTSRAYLIKDVFSVTFLRRLKSTSSRYLWFLKKNTQEMKRFLVAVHRYQSGLPWVSVGWYVRGSLCKLTVVKTQQ